MKISFKKKNRTERGLLTSGHPPPSMQALSHLRDTFCFEHAFTVTGFSDGEVREEAWCASVPTPYSPGETAETQGGHCLPESRHEEQSSEPLVSVWLAAGKIITGSSRCGGLPFRSQDLGRRGQVDLYEFQARGFNATNRAIERDPV